ncbi:hypothetical protein KSP40_PGU008077 [Platanthera guangdongensis]|uniref:Uncharacterized protein n=1 Tax=Platanthera guangdongensis TaxID=2320717 RepID=A0ABR2M9H4_9ASPA
MRNYLYELHNYQTTLPTPGLSQNKATPLDSTEPKPGDRTDASVSSSSSLSSSSSSTAYSNFFSGLGQDPLVSACFRSRQRSSFPTAVSSGRRIRMSVELPLRFWCFHKLSVDHLGILIRVVSLCGYPYANMTSGTKSNGRYDEICCSDSHDAIDRESGLRVRIGKRFSEIGRMNGSQNQAEGGDHREEFVRRNLKASRSMVVLCKPNHHDCDSKVRLRSNTSKDESGKPEIYCRQRFQPRRLRIAVPNAESQFFHYKQSISYAQKLRHDALICAAALNNLQCRVAVAVAEAALSNRMSTRSRMAKRTVRSGQNESA